MCTALSISSKEGNYYFGRNMDLAYTFNQSVIMLPRLFEFKDIVTGNTIVNNRAILGMGTVIDNHPTLADAMNENGLAAAGLNFQGYAYFEKKVSKDKANIPPYDFIQWVLSNYDTVEEVKNNLQNIELVDIPINEKTPCPTLHWMISDKSGKSIVVEKTKDKFVFYDNTVGVLTNNPTFHWHLTNLNEYIFITPNTPKNTTWSKQKLNPLGVGAGTLGIPGDFASVSRFVRIAYIRANMPEINNDINAVTQFFHMLDYVKMVKGGVITEDGLEELTLYSSCMDQEECIYYYKNYDNNRINAIDMKKEKLEGNELKIFEYLKVQDINYQN
ncbi:MAG: choloylglycine hydrolase family protein [Clostridium sp.]|uniref:choloylglycine hydrolase n=1 Tax=Clostridium sp. TaxID=1506 RepID=UPI0025BE355D|nr:choloylglycine hydrolase [Clostridium sp.]MCF0147240.1 choloylglycine hydrolase family protein [Clostridium sp.]